MSMYLNPYLVFAGDARAAMTFYQQVLGGELRINTFGEFGDPSMPGADGIMHAQLETADGFVLMASDLPPGQEGEVTRGGMAVSLSGRDDKLRDYWQALSEGAQVTMPFEKQMWGDEFGMLHDRFGVEWMVNLVASSEG